MIKVSPVTLSDAAVTRCRRREGRQQAGPQNSSRPASATQPAPKRLQVHRGGTRSLANPAPLAPGNRLNETEQEHCPAAISPQTATRSECCALADKPVALGIVDDILNATLRRTVEKRTHAAAEAPGVCLADGSLIGNSELAFVEPSPTSQREEAAHWERAASLFHSRITRRRR